MEVSDERQILHLDADAFFASVEQASDVRLRGRPVAVGGAKRGVVASASYEARREGVRTAMPTAHARKICPSLIVVPGDFEKYERFSRFVFSYAYDFTPSVEVASIDEGYADLSGLRRGSPRDVAERIRAAVRQTLRITLSEGVGSNKLVAAIGSKLRKPDALVEVARGREREFLSPLEVKWLPGVGPNLAGTLRRAGLPTIGGVARMMPGQLALFAGKLAPTLCEMARGIDPRPVVPDPPQAKSLSEQETFEFDSTDEDFVRARLRQMADRLAAKLRADGRTVRTVEVRLRYNDFDEVRRSGSLVEPTDLETGIYPLIDRLVRRAWERRVSVRLVGVKFSNLYGAEFQDTLGLGESGAGRLAEERPHWKIPPSASRSRRRALAGAVDLVRSEFGDCAVLRGHDLYLNARGAGAETPGAALRAKADHSRRATGAVRRGKRAAPGAALNIKSSYSFLESLLSPAEAVRLAAGAGCPAVALTDPNLHGAVELCQAAKAAGIRAVLAAEVEVSGVKKLAYVKSRPGYEVLCAALSGSVSLEGSEDGLIFAGGGSFPVVRYREKRERAMFHILQSIRTLTLADRRSGGRLAGDWAMDPVRGGDVGLAVRILDECDFVIETGGLNFPEWRPPDGSSAHAFLAGLAQDGLKKRYGRDMGKFLPQLREELKVIAEVGYEEYFLVVWELLQECRRAGYGWITRGSAADSLVCYALGISDVCPIRFELYFKRFLNRDRMALNKLPDIDIDFAHDRKDAVVDLIFRKYGEQAAVVGGFSTYRGRSAFADIAKVFGVSEMQIRRYTKNLPSPSAAHLRQSLARTRECGDLDFGEDPYATALELASRLDGFPRHPKMHPCGVVLARQPIATLCPVFPSRKGYPTTHFDMDSVEAIGLVKMDILAQGGLAVMRDAEAAIRKNGGGGRRCGARRDDFGDPAVWAMIAGGGARGVHHIESPAMTSLVRMVNVRHIDDLIAIVSVIRPGAANTMRKVSFARRAQGLEPVDCVHPSLEPVLRSTYGVVAYEEHILQICEAFAGMSAGRADILRRALVKGRVMDAEEFFGEFRDHAKKAGRNAEETARVWRLVMGFHGYAFCRAHSTAYGVEAYQAARLKLYHPAEFLSGVLTHGKGFYDRLTYSIECRRLGLTFRHPDVNDAERAFCATGREIRLPLSQVKGVSARLLAGIGRLAPFESVDDFVCRARPASDELDRLIRAGVLDVLGGSRVEQFWEARRAERGDGAAPLFRWAGLGGRAAVSGCPLPGAVRLRDEWEICGFPVSDHPLALFPDVAWDTYCPIKDVMRYAGRVVTLAGMIIARRSHVQADGRPMKFLSLCDFTGMVECEMYAGSYARFGVETVRHPVIEVTARVVPFDNRNGCTLDVKAVRACRRHG